MAVEAMRRSQRYGDEGGMRVNGGSEVERREKVVWGGQEY
jgi:hypothetical protein